MEVEFRLSILDDPAFQKFNRFVGGYKFGDPATLLFSAAESFIICEILHRKAERVTALGLTGEQAAYYEELSQVQNQQGLRRLHKAKEAVTKAIEMYPRIIEKEDELVSEDEMRVILSEYDAMLKDEILGLDIKGEESAEIWQEYTAAREIVSASGMSGLIEYLSSKIDELIELRTDLPKGRGPASPLPWWKIVEIALALVVSLAMVIYCYKKENCELVLELVSVIGGFLLEIVITGC